MKIFSELVTRPDMYGKETPTFALFLDTELTGDKNKDCLYAAADYTPIKDSQDADKILTFLIELLSSAVYTAYGEKPEYYGKKEPLTQYHRTGFDPNYPNGVKL